MSSLGLRTGVWLLADEEHVDDNMHIIVTWQRIFHSKQKAGTFPKKRGGWKGKEKK